MDTTVQFPELLTEREAAAIARVSVHNVKYWRYTRKIAFLKAGKRILIRADELARFLGLPKPPQTPTPELPLAA